MELLSLLITYIHGILFLMLCMYSNNNVHNNKKLKMIVIPILNIYNLNIKTPTVLLTVVCMKH